MQSAKSDIYVALLGISLAAIIIAILLMGIILYQYDMKVSVASALPALQPGAVASQLASVVTGSPLHLTS